MTNASTPLEARKADLSSTDMPSRVGSAMNLHASGTLMPLLSSSLRAAAGPAAAVFCSYVCVVLRGSKTSCSAFAFSMRDHSTRPSGWEAERRTPTSYQLFTQTDEAGAGAGGAGAAVTGSATTASTGAGAGGAGAATTGSVTMASTHTESSVEYPQSKPSGGGPNWIWAEIAARLAVRAMVCGRPWPCVRSAAAGRLLNTSISFRCTSSSELRRGHELARGVKHDERASRAM
eukprot:scaffold43634_cov64-Phaeocystis_antarctica.AAC.12